jgi:hypothetical protein
MKTIFYILLLNLNISSNAQEIPWTKQNLNQIFKDNSKGTTHSFGRKELDQFGVLNKEKYSNWYARNNDSLYFHSDTITLVNHRRYRQDFDWEKVRVWTIKKRNMMFQTDATPPSYCVQRDWYKYKFVNKKDQVELIIIFKGKVIETFEIIRLELLKLNDDPNEPMYSLTLKRKMSIE